MSQPIRHSIFIIQYSIFILLLSACNPTKYLAEDELLYNGASVEMDKNSKVQEPKTLTNKLLTYARPQKNNAFQLWAYNAFQKPEKEKGFGNLIANKLGQAPILYNPNDLTRSRALTENYLQDNGYFNSSVSFDTTIQDQKLTVTYTVDSEGQYKIRDVYFPADTTVINHIFSEQAQNSVIKKNHPYQVTALDAERLRLATIARNRGYFQFNPDLIYYFVDTTVNTLQADIYLRVSNDQNLKQYHMDTTFVYPTYNIESTRSARDTVLYKDLKVVQRQDFVRKKPLKRVIAQDEGSLFREDLQDQTINHLLDLGVFKFVNVKYENMERGDTNFLRRHIYLTPALTQDVNGEIEASTETTNFLGSAISGSYTHRNLLKGAEQLTMRLSAGVETQINNPELPFINTLELSAQASLFLPRFLFPFRKEKVFTYYIPKTRISISDNFQRRTSFFTINSFQFDFGYQWQTTKYRRHSFKPLSINLVQLLDITDDFNTILENNERLAQSFSNIAILGMHYRFTYNDQEINTLKDFLFFQLDAETAGNVVSLVADSENRLFGTIFSQYAKLDLDTRYNILQKKDSWVGRLNIGVGIPYGNSTVMPYIKQYFVGGANSIRAFQLRGLGPGSTLPDTAQVVNFFDQTGDIKIEANLEYRFDLFPYVEGAAFVDAGNVWFLRDQDGDERFRDAQFQFDSFLSQMAVGTGLGLRLDLEFLLLRLDVAFPIRRPTLPPGNRWVFDQIAFGQQQWRQDNLSFNLAVGYPF
ncbi:MAG: BamA/TamA family outer membrane protein [Bacteroidota bacterium]